MQIRNAISQISRASLRPAFVLQRPVCLSAARRIYHVTPDGEREVKKRHLAEILSVGESTVRGWLSRIDKDTERAREKTIFKMWLACYTQGEIAKEVGRDQSIISDFMGNGKVSKFHKIPDSEHQTDFAPPLYNIWKQQSKTNKVSHFGNTEVTLLDNLLYLYTSPFNIVVDPFAGGPG